MSEDTKKPKPKKVSRKPKPDGSPITVGMADPDGNMIEIPVADAQEMLDAGNKLRAADKAAKAAAKLGRVTSVDIQHALRASLLLETSGGGLQSTYSSLEVGIQIHVEGIPEDADFKQVVADYAADVMQMVAQRVNEDARALGFRAFTEGTDGEDAGDDAQPVSEAEL